MKELEQGLEMFEGYMEQISEMGYSLVYPEEAFEFHSLTCELIEAAKQVQPHREPSNYFCSVQV